MHRTRNFRRKQLIKKKHRFEKIAIQELQGEIDPDRIKQWAAHVAAAPKKPCQCCCNPRHSVLYKEHEKLTIQERKDAFTKKEAHEEGVWMAFLNIFRGLNYDSKHRYEIAEEIPRATEKRKSTSDRDEMIKE